MPIIGKLLIRSGVSIGNEIDIDRDLLRIGRDSANEFAIDDIEVSRNHAKISRVDNVYKIEDLNSTNGTFLNGRKIFKPEVIKDGDLISLGENNVFEVSLEKVDAIDEPQGVEKPEIISEVKEGFRVKKNRKTIEPDEEKASYKDSKYRGVLQKLSKLPIWAVVLLIALGFLIIFCLIPLLFIEITNQWCILFSGFFNAMSPGICP